MDSISQDSPSSSNSLSRDCAKALSVLFRRDILSDVETRPVEQGGLNSLLQGWISQGRLMNDYVITHAKDVDADDLVRPPVDVPLALGAEIAPEGDTEYTVLERPEGLALAPGSQVLPYGDAQQVIVTDVRQRAKLDKKWLRRIRVVRTTIRVASLPATSTGWAGKDYHRRADQGWLYEAWEKRTIVRLMLSDLAFTKEPYEGPPLLFVDENGTTYGYRTSRFEWMFRVPKLGGKIWMDLLKDDNEKYMKWTGPRSLEDTQANLRGSHYAMVIGTDCQNKREPSKTQFHRKHEKATAWLLRPDGPTQRLIRTAKSVFESRFPSLAARVINCTASLQAMGGAFAEHAQPQFGYWFNYCVNGPSAEYGVDGVFTKPHVDGKNLAIMMCVVFVWGQFDHSERAWLVLWEAGIIIELPPGVFLFYPSSLFTHFNVDICDAEIVTTADGSRPTRETASPLRGVPGRGSIVFFNQASMFQRAELKSSVKDARAAGRQTTCDNEPHIAALPVM